MASHLIGAAVVVGGWFGAASLLWIVVHVGTRRPTPQPAPAEHVHGGPLPEAASAGGR